MFYCFICNPQPAVAHYARRAPKCRQHFLLSRSLGRVEGGSNSKHQLGGLALISNGPKIIEKASTCCHLRCQTQQAQLGSSTGAAAAAAWVEIEKKTNRKKVSKCCHLPATPTQVFTPSEHTHTHKHTLRQGAKHRPAATKHTRQAEMTPTLLACPALALPSFSLFNGG